MSFQYLAVRYDQLYFTVSDLHCLRDVFVFFFLFFFAVMQGTVQG